MALNVWPCDLLIDMEKHGLQGNWRRRNWKGSSESEGIRDSGQKDDLTFVGSTGDGGLIGMKAG